MQRLGSWRAVYLAETSRRHLDCCALPKRFVRPAVTAGTLFKSNRAENKEKVRKIGVGQPLTVIQQDGSEHHGNLLSIQTETFSIQEFPSASGPPVTTTIAYSDVKKIQKGIRR